MRLLLDTQLAIWWQIKPEAFSQSTLELVHSADSVFISRASVWEMAVKCSLGKLRIDLPLFCQSIEQNGFQWLDIKQTHILNLSTLPQFDDHKDPFDRLLISQSLNEPLIFLTADSKLSRYDASVRLV